MKKNFHDTTNAYYETAKRPYPSNLAFSVNGKFVFVNVVIRTGYSQHDIGFSNTSSYHRNIVIFEVTSCACWTCNMDHGDWTVLRIVRIWFPGKCCFDFCYRSVHRLWLQVVELISLTEIWKYVFTRICLWIDISIEKSYCLFFFSFKSFED